MSVILRVCHKINVSHRGCQFAAGLDEVATEYIYFVTDPKFKEE